MEIGSPQFIKHTAKNPDMYAFHQNTYRDPTQKSMIVSQYTQHNPRIRNYERLQAMRKRMETKRKVSITT